MAASLPYPALHATHGGIWIAWPDGRVEAVGRGAGDRARGRNADDHAERAAGRQPARLSRPLRARPARAVRLRPSGPLRGADAEGHRPRARPRRAGGRRRGGRLPARGGRARCSQTLGGGLARARRRLGVGAGALPAALALGAGRSPSGCQRPERDEPWLFSRLPEWEESGGRAAAAAGPARPRRHVATGSSGWSATAPRPRQGQRDYAAAAAAVFAPRQRRGPAQPAARRGRHRDRQDAGLSRPRLALGARGRRRGLDLDLHQGAAAPARPRGRRGSSPTRPSAGARS